MLILTGTNLANSRRKTSLLLVLWSLQLVPAGFLIVFVLARIRTVTTLNSVDVKTGLALAAGLSWLVFAIAMLATRSGRNWLVTHWREWILVATSSMIAVLIFDIGLTVSGLVPTIDEATSRSIQYAPGGFVKARLVPQDIIIDGGRRIHINRRGFRGGEFAPIKEPGTTRIVFLGGSQVFDYHGGGWPSMVGDELAQRGFDVEVINAGVAGHDSADSLGKLFTDVWVLDPDIIFHCNTWNDIKYFPMLSPANPYRGLPPIEPTPIDIDWRLHPTGPDRLLSYSSLYRAFRVAIIESIFSPEGRRLLPWDDGRVQSGDSSQWAGGIGPSQFELNLRLISAAARAIKADLVVCRQARLKSGRGTTGQTVEEYALKNIGVTRNELNLAFAAAVNIIDRVSATEGFQVVDMDAALEGEPQYFHDGIHFSTEGSRRVANYVADALSSLLAGENSNPDAVTRNR